MPNVRAGRKEKETQMRQRAPLFVKIYVARMLVSGLLLAWSGIVNGGLERHHDLKDWVSLLSVSFGEIAISSIWVIVALLGVYGLYTHYH